LISVGGLLERKGFHRVIEVLPRLLDRHPGFQYLIVGSGGPEGNYEGVLRDLVERHALTERVRFLRQVPPERLAEVLSAGDCFVLATSNEGWANVFLEAMACGLPVITTDVGGNTEVVSDPSLGAIVPFGDPDALATAIDAGLGRAAAGGWEQRVRVLVDSLRRIAAQAHWRAPPVSRAAGTAGIPGVGRARCAVPSCRESVAPLPESRL
jgi:glycosyltransferase involved in cell wall biosynthesis